MRIKIIGVIIILLFFTDLVGCEEKNSKNISLDGIHNYNWNASFDEIANDLKNKNFEVYKRKDAIVSVIDFYGISSLSDFLCK